MNQKYTIKLYCNSIVCRCKYILAYLSQSQHYFPKQEVSTKLQNCTNFWRLSSLLGSQRKLRRDSQFGTWMTTWKPWSPYIHTPWKARVWPPPQAVFLVITSWVWCQKVGETDKPLKLYQSSQACYHVLRIIMNPVTSTLQVYEYYSKLHQHSQWSMGKPY